jgi:LmbE family N-acetylglucosaminyl deacetylase
VTYRPDEREGGLAAIFAHPDDESFAAAGTLALAHDTGRTVRLLLLTRGEAGNDERTPDLDLADAREEGSLRGGADRMDEVTVMDHPDGRLAEVEFSVLVDKIATWLADRRPNAVITFGPHGVTSDPDHVVVGSATRWAVERLAESGIAPNAVYVIAPSVGRERALRPLPEEGATRRRIRQRLPAMPARVPMAALGATRASPTWPTRSHHHCAARPRRRAVQGFTRVRPALPAAHQAFCARID